MLAKAKERAYGAKVPVKLQEMDAQKLEFADACFDTVVATCVFCSVPEQIHQKFIKNSSEIHNPDELLIDLYGIGDYPIMESIFSIARRKLVMAIIL